MTVRSTFDYCKEMLRLSGNPYEKVSEEDLKRRCEIYVHKVIEYDRAKTISGHLDELYELSPFPSDIRGYLHEYTGEGIFQPKHLMCKIATIRVPDITFEFLVEYGILEADVEIYYGIKAISDDTETTEDFAAKVTELSDSWFDYIKQYKNLTRGPYAGHYHRHKFTNNVHDGTFWISWVRMESEEDMETVVKDLQKKVYQGFKRFISTKSDDKRWVISSIDEDEDSPFNKIFDKLIKSKVCMAKNDPCLLTGKREKELSDKEKAKEDKRKEVLEKLEKMCLEKDRNSTTGENLIIKRDNGYYRFVCENDIAWIFIQKLFCEESFNNAFKYAEEFWEKLTSKKRIVYGRSFTKFVESKEPDPCKNCLNKLAKSEIDKSWVKEFFRAKDGSKFKTSFFKQGKIQFDDYGIFKNIKEKIGKSSAL